MGMFTVLGFWLAISVQSFTFSEIPDRKLLEERIPRMFNPVAGDSDSANRLAEFIETMSWQEVTVSAFEAAQEAALQLESLLIEGKDRNFEFLLRKFGFIDPNVVFPDLPGDLAIYGPLFQTLHMHRPLFRAVLESGKTRETFYKMVMTASRLRSFPNISALAADVCGAFSNKIDHSHPEFDRWHQACSSGEFVDMFMNLSARELHLVLRKNVRFRHSSSPALIVPTDQSLQVFIAGVSARKGEIYAHDEIFNRVKAIPIEVQPHSKYMCIAFRLSFYCESVIRQFAQVQKSVPDWASRIAQFRVFTRMFPTLFPTDLEPVSLGFELDFELEDELQELGLAEEAASVNHEMLKIFQLVHIWPGMRVHWPLFERVLKAQDGMQQLNELQFVGRLQAENLLFSVKYLCSQFPEVPECRNLRRELTRIHPYDLNLLMDRSIDATEMAQQILGLDEEDMRRRARIGEFIRRNKKTVDLVEQGKTCCICFTEFQAYVVEPVELCPPDKECDGHHLCEPCTRGLYDHQHRLDCPLCKRLVMDGTI